MPIIKSISSLRNYQKVLTDVQAGQPVFLTKNGTGRYAVVEINEYNLLVEQSWQRLIKELQDSRNQAETEGWVDDQDFNKRMDTLIS